MSKVAISYARVSTPKQLKKGYSIERQQSITARWAEKNGYQIVARYSEQCQRWTSEDERIPLLACVHRSKQLDCPILIEHWDRLCAHVDRPVISCHAELSAGRAAG
jgi:hypothetical protein